MYAVGGEVRISSAPVRGDPEATVEKAEQIVRAAMAPADPSPQDQAVAAQASQMAIQARLEIARNAQGDDEAPSAPGSVRTPDLSHRISDMTGSDREQTSGRLLAVA